MRKICFLLLVLVATRANAQNKDYIISMEGLGSLKLGMTQTELEKTLHQKIRLTNYLDTINDYFQDTAKLLYKNIRVQLEFERNYYAPYKFNMRLIGIRASSPLCKTVSGIGIGSDKLKIITAYEDYPITLQQGHVNYYHTEKSKTKSTISISDDSSFFMIRLFLLNNKVVSFELKSFLPDELSLKSDEEE
jgi:hypothetical protein